MATVILKQANWKPETHAHILRKLFSLLLCELINLMSRLHLLLNMRWASLAGLAQIILRYK